MSKQAIRIGDREVGENHPTFVIAEISANHNHDLNEALELIEIAKGSGADAVKIQTYTPDTMTIDSNEESFVIGEGTIWEGKNLYSLYGEAYTPWEWHGELFKRARELGIIIFSTPFDASSVDFLEQFDPPAYKIASFELVDIPLIRKVAQTGRPMIISTGMGSHEEVCEAVGAAKKNGCAELILLKCTSAYPAPAAEANLARIPAMANEFGVTTGLSDHTMGSVVPVTAVALGARVIEKHFTKSRAVPGPDSSFSMEPAEFSQMVKDIRVAEEAVGDVTYERTSREEASMVFRRSVFVVEDIEEGEVFSKENIRVIRPGYGMAPKYIEKLYGMKASTELKRGTPMNGSYVEGEID